METLTLMPEMMLLVLAIGLQVAANIIDDAKAVVVDEFPRAESDAMHK